MHPGLCVKPLWRNPETVPSKTIPDSRPKWAKSIPVFRPKRRQNHTLWGGTYLYTHIREYPPGSISHTLCRRICLLYCRSLCCACNPNFLLNPLKKNAIVCWNFSNEPSKILISKLFFFCSSHNKKNRCLVLASLDREDEEPYYAWAWKSANHPSVPGEDTKLTVMRFAKTLLSEPFLWQLRNRIKVK